MDELRFRSLDQHAIENNTEGLTLALPLPRSPKGLVYRMCPKGGCSPKLFLLGDAPDDQSIPPDRVQFIRRTPGMPGTTCPYCGSDAEDHEYTAAEDIESAKEYVEWAVMRDVSDFIGAALDGTARNINRSGGKFLSARYTPSPNEPAPSAWREDLLRNLTCDTCQRHYGVYAIGLFCPDCGARNFSVHFSRETELVAKQIALAESTDDEELAYRLLGNAHEDVLTALEAYLKAAFRFVVLRRSPERYESLCSPKAIRNDFQNVDRGRKQFAQFSIDPYARVDANELSSLRFNIEKRHVVGHNLGIADENYVRTDQNQQTGQTVRILAEEIGHFAQICAKVIATIEELPHFLPPSPAIHPSEGTTKTP